MVSASWFPQAGRLAPVELRSAGATCLGNGTGKPPRRHPARALSIAVIRTPASSRPAFTTATRDEELDRRDGYRALRPMCTGFDLAGADELVDGCSSDREHGRGLRDRQQQRCDSRSRPHRTSLDPVSLFSISQQIARCSPTRHERFNPSLRRSSSPVEVLPTPMHRRCRTRRAGSVKRLKQSSVPVVQDTGESKPERTRRWTAGRSRDPRTMRASIVASPARQGLDGCLYRCLYGGLCRHVCYLDRCLTDRVAVGLAGFRLKVDTVLGDD